MFYFVFKMLFQAYHFEFLPRFQFNFFSCTIVGTIKFILIIILTITTGLASCPRSRCSAARSCTVVVSERWLVTSLTARDGTSSLTPAVARLEVGTACASTPGAHPLCFRPSFLFPTFSVIAYSHCRRTGCLILWVYLLSKLESSSLVGKFSVH